MIILDREGLQFNKCSTANEVVYVQCSRFTENLMNDLTDFSNVAISSRYSCLQKPSPQGDYSCFQHQQLDLANHSKLLEQFKRLRDKLKQETKRSNAIKREWEKCEGKYQEKIERLEMKEKENDSGMRYLKREVEVINEGIDKLKRRNVELEKECIVKNNYEREIESLGMRVKGLEAEKEELMDEKTKIQEILLLEKLEVEARLNEVNSTNQSQLNHYLEVERELIKSRELNITLQSKIKRLKDQHQLQEIEKSDISKSNQLSLENDQLRAQNSQLKARLQEQKSRRKKQENIEFKKHEINCLYNLQNQAQEKELNQLRKRVEKLTDRYQIKAVQAECEAFKSMETLAKLWKSIDIAQEIIHRVKKQGGHQPDLDQFIKVSEYKLNKIKESQNKNPKHPTHSSASNLIPRRKESTKSKSRSRSKSPSCHTAQKAKEDSSLPTEFHSYTTPKLKQPTISFTETLITPSKNIEERVRKEMREKENQLRAEIEFQKYRKVEFGNHP